MGRARSATLGKPPLLVGMPLARFNQAASHDAGDTSTRGDSARATTILAAAHTVLGGREIVVK